MDKKYEVGQRWSYETLPGFESSHVIIGAIEEIADVGEIVCVTLVDVPLPTPDGSAPSKQTINFVPFARASLDACLIMRTGDGELPVEFNDLLADWKNETGGEEFLPITVPMFLDMLAAGSRG